VIFGGLGRDDLIGGSSTLFGTGGDSGNRPDGADLIFGGDGTAADRNDERPGHGADSDVIVGDNGLILRLVGDDGGYLGFNYDTYGETLRLLVRAVQLLDYTPGGPAVSAGALGTDIGGSDEIHGEGGDDTVYAGRGDDVVFGDAGDDDLIGGWGFDWISGGTGQDGVLGDDGRILTSRNPGAPAAYTTAGEPLYGIAPVPAAERGATIASPGDMQTAVINAPDQLAKTVVLTPFGMVTAGGAPDPLTAAPYADDVIFGGLGSDFLHGGFGDDAVSGAEALTEGWAPTYAGGIRRSDWNRPFNDGSLLGFDPATGMFGLYDPADPMGLVTFDGTGTPTAPCTPFTGTAPAVGSVGGCYVWFLTGDHREGPAQGSANGSPIGWDGDDVLFGDDGNDWLVGGTGRDTLWGGWGNDLLDADDDKSTVGGANTSTDTHATYEDRAVGGAGVDVLIANTGGDRLIDWAGEFNSYLVPFGPFGMATVSRQLAPGLMEFLYALGHAQGADRTRGGDPARYGEPFGELGLVLQQDAAWGDQTGGPRDPQPGNTGGEPRDVLRTADDGTTSTTTGTSDTVTSDPTATSGTEVVEPAPLPVVTVGDVSVKEGNGGTTTATLVVSLSEVSDVDVTVRLEVVGGTATAGADYAAWSGGYVDVVILAGQTSATVSIDIVVDKLREADETVVVEATSATNATTTGDAGTLTIVNDDNK
jgi:hypothetical protein